ncbi:outer membrane lipoprotein-sorting protein [Candidatus Dependentiae bacterium]|nr:outer membrane lipoprotein-sorting protein [Candidatus Dependentiae bacterium]
MSKILIMLILNILILKSFIFGAAGVTVKITAESLMKELERQTTLTSDAKAKVIVTQQKIKQGVKKIEMVYFRRDRDDAFLIIMEAPESDRGNGYLKTGDNFWMYRRNTRTFQHINRDENIAGTDAKGDDFEKRKLSELYKPATDKTGNDILSEEIIGKIPVYKYELIAKVNDVDYPKKIYWVQKDNFLPLKEQAFSLSGTLMQTVYYLKYSTVDGKYVPNKMMYIDEFEKGNKTIVDLTEFSTKKIEDSVFTKAYLENMSK